MGLFCLDLEKTAESAVKTAIANLQMWQKENRGDPQYDYLLWFAQKNVEDAIKRFSAPDAASDHLATDTGSGAAQCLTKSE